MTHDADEDVAPAFQRVTLLDRTIRFAIGAVIAALVMVGVSPLLEPIADVFFPIAASIAVIAGVACTIWGGRFLEPFLRAIGRIW
jgi:hypothetical protein